MIAAALLGGCAANEGVTTIEHTHDACAPLALVATAPSAEQFAGMEGAQALWLDRGAPALGRRAGETLEVRFQAAAAQFRGLYDDAESVIYVNDRIVDEATLSIVIAHELGHAFGLVHVPASERASVMNPGNVTVQPTVDDQAAIQALWGECQP